VLCIVLSVVCCFESCVLIFCDVCYCVLYVIVVPLPPGINPLAVINNIYRVIQNDCWGFNNLSYTIHFR
jgi:hypothetical protein